MNKIIYLLLCLVIVSCKKDVEPEADNDPVVQDDTREVRILKVEQTVSPNTFPFSNHSLMSVEYIYDSDQLTSIKTKDSNGEEMTFILTQGEDGQSTITFPDTESMKDPFFRLHILKSLNIRKHNDKVIQVSNDYEVTLIGMGSNGSKQRTAEFTYNVNGLLHSVKSNFTGDNGIPTWNGKVLNWAAREYSQTLLKKFKILNHNPLFNGQSSGQDLEVNVNYEKASEIPDGLIRKVNQAILGLHHLGFEDYFFHWIYDISEEHHLTLMERLNEIKAHPAYTFADWIIGFGLQQHNMLPEQNNQLIASKEISGKVFTDIDPSTIAAIYHSVDTTISFPYLHDKSSRTLEIYGLKIYYQILE